MPCLQIRQADGKPRLVLIRKGESIPMTIGEVVLGVDQSCDESNIGDPSRPPVATASSVNVDKELEDNGLKLGDTIAWVTSKLGITQCPPCKARQEIFNEMNKVGIIETIKRIKATLV